MATPRDALKRVMDGVEDEFWMTNNIHDLIQSPAWSITSKGKVRVISYDEFYRKLTRWERVKWRVKRFFGQ